MLRDISWPEDRSYKKGKENEPIQFYMDALSNSKSFDLLLGYFSSAAINVLSLSFASFLYSGGKMRMIINNILSAEDKDAIIAAKTTNFQNDLIDLSNIKDLKRSLGDYGIHFFECIAWLIANNRIEIKIIKPKKGEGIAHYKNGIFYDGQDYVGFSASCNFTFYGLIENLERLETFLSWENSRSTKFTSGIKKDIESILREEDTNVEYLDIEQVQIAIKNEFGDKSINELLIKEKELIQRKDKALENKELRKTIEKLIAHIEEIIREPRFPYPEGPREYQNEAYNNWRANGFKGVFAMATGTGKTITSLNCLLNEYKVSKSYRAVIVVPTTALLQQWKKECDKFNFKNVLTISTSENWNDDLSFLHTAAKLINTSFIVIVTYASLIRPKFQSHFNQLPDDTLFIADEAHNMGSPSLLRLLPRIHLGKRIGLSATPNRKYDDLGNEAIEQFFKDKSPFVYSYTMKQAMEVGWLCKYTYYPRIVPLKDVELKEYLRISRQLLKYFDSKTGGYKKSVEVEMLLLERKRIIHKAENKLSVFKGIVSDEFRKRKNLKYTLIYVPEGKEPDYELNDDFVETEEDISLIDEYTKAVSRTDTSIMVKQYTAGTKNRGEILNDFEAGKIHTLTSMKCLDEGVDVPRSELAIFCSSTGNPRQFIQRRGRVLRLHKNKVHAVIYDLIVVPGVGSEEETYSMERSLVRKEIERVVDFSTLAMNRADTYDTLKDTLDYYNLNLYDFEDSII